MFRKIIAGVFLAMSVAVAFSGIGAAAAAVSQIIPAKVMTFKDWAVGCDNGLSCEAVTLNPKSSAENTLSLAMNRTPVRNGGLSINVSGFATGTDRYRILIDKRVIDTGAVGPDKETIIVTGADAVKLARAMAKGWAFSLIDGNGQNLGRASLAGVSATLRYMDTTQGRLGSRGAIVANARRPARVKKSFVPMIAARRIAPSEQLPEAPALVALSESSPCAKERFGATEDAAYSLGPTQSLVLLNCGSGAYNFSVGAYIGNRDLAGKWTFAPATFDYTPNRLNEKSDLALLVNADWNGATQTLSSYAKGRGIGDCGSSEQYVWDGSMFRLIQATQMDECRGSLDWITVWRAEVSLTS
ncbi:MAG: DUF1176 domain-containing protein [Sphingorhabdus sp.]